MLYCSYIKDVCQSRRSAPSQGLQATRVDGHACREMDEAIEDFEHYGEGEILAVEIAL